MRIKIDLHFQRISLKNWIINKNILYISLTQINEFIFIDLITGKEEEINLSSLLPSER